jgi:hypothetical protein
MSGVETGLHWLALGFTCAAFVIAIAALMARSLFAMCMYLAAAGVLGAAAMLALGAGDAGLAAALFLAAWAPLLLLAAMLLTARATKAKRRSGPWFSLAAALVTAGGVLAVVPELGDAATPAAGGAGAIGAWLAPLLLVAAAACVGLLGFGERGALQQHAETEP